MLTALIIISITLLIAILAFLMSVFFLAMLLFLRVPYVKTPEQVIERIISEVPIDKSQTVCDLGCGDAEFLITVSKRTGARTIGYELSPIAYQLAKYNIWQNHATTKVYYKNFYKQDFSDADLVFCFLVPSVMEKVRKLLEPQLKHGARVVSYAFPLPGWQPSQTLAPLLKTKKASSIYIYQR